MTPLISIIIPTYNRAHLIGETLNSVLEQTYTNWECIIVDDGSMDTTDEVVGNYVKKDSRFQYHYRPKDRKKGPNSCRNYGFVLSKGEFIKWFDSDDVMHSTLLEQQIASFEEAIDCSVCKVAHYDFENKITLKENTIYSNQLIEDYLVGRITFYVSGPLWRKSFLNNQNELFDDNLSNLDDWDFNLRMLYCESKIAFIDIPLIKYRIHKDSLSKEIGKFNFDEIQSEIKAREKHIRILCNNQLVNPTILIMYIKARYQYFLREALVRKDEYKWHYLKGLLKYQMQLLDITGIMKTFFGFILYSLFNKGYKFL
ncbi:glycosyltransferase family 2 protein [Flavobacterium succinicans]|uniref:Putative glycosyltransferase EpsH n=1 Tax=Flavobacterium succinicans TaxID=29536 RepID=A0A199XVX8_9FLAO|nr:glycosyltransferase family 2 protein [Flavobacterium succinicans]OAZ05411.1 putative glycosyltransferase EpsH [Flavobacterium succinicans]